MSQSELGSVIVLENHWITLEPAAVTHHDELVKAASDGELWKLSATTTIPIPDRMQKYIDDALEKTAVGEQQGFAVRRASDGKIVGTTRYYDIEPQNRRRAIGWTWYSKSAQRTRSIRRRS